MTSFAPDRTPNRAPIWFVADACGALTLGFVTVVQMTRPDAVDEFGAVGFPGWFLVMAPAALIVVRRLAPLTVLAAAIGIYLVAAFDYGEGEQWYEPGSNPVHEKILDLCAQHFDLARRLMAEDHRHGARPVAVDHREV